MVLMVIPAKPRIISAMNIESGMAIPTKSEFLVPKKNKSTVTTSITPKMMLLPKLLTCSLVSLD